MLKQEVTGVTILTFFERRGVMRNYYSQLQNGKPVFLHRDNDIEPEPYKLYRCVISETERYVLAQIIREVGVDETWEEDVREARERFKEGYTLKEYQKDYHNYKEEEREKKAYKSASRTSRMERAAKMLDEKERTKIRRIKDEEDK